jgi:hypothetical protein
MKIAIYRRPKTIPIQKIKEALWFYTESLMHKRLCNKLSIRIVFIKNMVEKQGLEASCTWEDNNIKPREFLIYIDSNLNEDEILGCLAHEMVHVKQWAKMEMKQYMRKSEVHWMGKPVDESIVSYYDLPWEQEAWRLEKELSKAFKEKCNEETKEEEPSG